MSQQSEKSNDLHQVEDLICFALYSANNAMNKAYKPHLAPLGLTYPQYITLTALWEKDRVTVGSLCKKLLMETSTLTPVLKRLESQGHLVRKRDTKDERQVIIHLTESGRALRIKAPDITRCIVDDTKIAANQLDELVETISRLRVNLLEKQ